MSLGPGDGARDDAAVLHLFGVAPTERQPDVRLVRGDDRRPLGSEGENIELEHTATDLEEACDQPMERGTALELAAAADGGGHLTRVDDRAVLQIFFDRLAREDQVDPGEPRGRDENDQCAEKNELVPDAEAHAIPGPSPEGDDPALPSAVVAAAP